MTEQAEVPVEFAAVFADLKRILELHASSLVITANAPGDYCLATNHLQPNKSPLSFGAVQIKKNYVSFHLVPVYACPELLTNLSTALRARMQGKACFNFKKRDPALFEELSQLTHAAFEAFKNNGWL